MGAEVQVPVRACRFPVGSDVQTAIILWIKVSREGSLDHLKLFGLQLGLKGANLGGEFVLTSGSHVCKLTESPC